MLLHSATPTSGLALLTSCWMLCSVGVAQSPSPEVRPGWDWSLPATVEPVPYSGYVTWGRKRFDPAITVRGIHATWKRLNPEPGVYDWGWLEEQIRLNSAEGMRTGIHLKGVQRDAVPDWVVETLHPVVIDVPTLQDNQPWRISNVLPWQPEVDRAFHEFFRAFAATGIAPRDDVVYGYIHGISASRGEEMFIRRVDLDMWQETTGLTAVQFADWLKRRIEAMCAAFKGVEYKLAVMFADPLGPTAEFRAATRDLCDHAISRGTGIRGGGIDFMHVLFDSRGWATRLDAEGYCHVDDAHPVICERRFRGDENEEYGAYWEWRFGPVEGYSYRHRICVLRGLQMQQNFQYVSKATLALNPALNEYARITQGYRRDDSPDAWAYLREAYPRRQTVKNIERWLVQRDLPGSQSVPAERIDRHHLSSDRDVNPHDYDARRTDMAHGQNGLLFRLDRVFWPEPAPAVLKVTFTDRAATRWWVSYSDGTTEPRRTPGISNTGEGQRKTATLDIPRLSADGRFPHDAGFQAWANAIPEDPPELLRNAEFAAGQEHWTWPEEAYALEDDVERTGKKRLAFMFRYFEDTPHVDQLVELKKGTRYRIQAEILNAGTNLKPCIRVARMDWSTVRLLSVDQPGAWTHVDDTFTVAEDGPVRVQLFGQGRQYHAPGQTGRSYFRQPSLKAVPRDELLDDRSMDFRIETDGPGDLTITMVRVVKKDFSSNP